MPTIYIVISLPRESQHPSVIFFALSVQFPASGPCINDWSAPAPSFRLATASLPPVGQCSRRSRGALPRSRSASNRPTGRACPPRAVSCADASQGCPSRRGSPRLTRTRQSCHPRPAGMIPPAAQCGDVGAGCSTCPRCRSRSPPAADWRPFPRPARAPQATVTRPIRSSSGLDAHLPAAHCHCAPRHADRRRISTRTALRGRPGLRRGLHGPLGTARRLSDAPSAARRRTDQARPASITSSPPPRRRVLPRPRPHDPPTTGSPPPARRPAGRWALIVSPHRAHIAQGPPTPAPRSPPRAGKGRAPRGCQRSCHQWGDAEGPRFWGWWPLTELQFLKIGGFVFGGYWVPELPKGWQNLCLITCRGVAGSPISAQGRLPSWAAQRSAGGRTWGCDTPSAPRATLAGGRWRGVNALCAGNPASPRDPRHPHPLSVPTHPR